MANKTIFSQNLVKARKAKRWSQEGAARSIGIKRSVLGSYEEGRAEPSHSTLLLIAEAYHIKDLQAFMSDKDYVHPEMSPDTLFDHYTKVPWYKRKAINAILGIDY
jgi:transcriptional regulator with XRE-family HTH domain